MTHLLVNCTVKAYAMAFGIKLFVKTFSQWIHLFTGKMHCKWNYNSSSITLNCPKIFTCGMTDVLITAKLYVNGN